MFDYYVVEVGRIGKPDYFYHSFGPFSSVAESLEKIASLKRREVDFFTTIPIWHV